MQMNGVAAVPLMALTSGALWQEHCALGRQWGRLQQRITELLRQKERELAERTAEVVRLRGQLMVLRTAQQWDMRGQPCA